MNYIDKSIDLIRLTKEKNPLVDFAVNYVTANDSTSVTSYIGGSPVMTDDSIDAADVVEYGNVDALIFNIGTITEKQYHSMMEAVRKATEKGIPIVIDPEQLTVKLSFIPLSKNARATPIFITEPGGYRPFIILFVKG